MTEERNTEKVLGFCSLHQNCTLLNCYRAPSVRVLRGDSQLFVRFFSLYCYRFTFHLKHVRVLPPPLIEIEISAGHASCLLPCLSCPPRSCFSSPFGVFNIFLALPLSCLLLHHVHPRNTFDFSAPSPCSFHPSSPSPEDRTFCTSQPQTKRNERGPLPFAPPSTG